MNNVVYDLISNDVYSGKNWKTGDPIYLFGSFRVYPFTMILGIICAVITILYFWRKNKFQIDILLTMIIITIPTAIIGARLFWIIEEAINGGNLSRWYAIWDGGLSIQGGVIIPMICNLLYLSRKKNVIEIRKVFGIVVPAILIGQVIGRWGNFANHELYGSPCSWNAISWLGNGIAQNMYIDGQFRIPLFLIESFISLIGYILIVWIFLQFNYFRPGTTGGLYFIWYGITRTILEPFRDPADFEYWYLVLAILFIVIGVVLVIYFEYTGRKIYAKQKYRKYSYCYINIKKPVMVINLNSKWINQ